MIRHCVHLRLLRFLFIIAITAIAEAFVGSHYLHHQPPKSIIFCDSALLYSRDFKVVINETLAPSYSGIVSLLDEEEEEDDLFSVPLNSEFLEIATNQLVNLPVGSFQQKEVDALKRIISAWPHRRSVRAAVNVERLLKRLIDEKHVHPSLIQIDIAIYVAAIEAWGRAEVPGGAQRAQLIHDALEEHGKHYPELRPSTESYKALLLAWRDNATASEIIFQQIPEPDLSCYTALMDNYSRALPSLLQKERAVARCEEIFDSIPVKRSQYCYSVLQNVYAKSGLPDAVKKTIGILRTLQTAHANGDVHAKPTISNYNAVLRALCRDATRRNAEFAISLLDKLILPVEEGGYDVVPDRLSYANTISVCSRCTDRDFAAIESERQLQRMEATAAAEAELRDHTSSVAPPLVTLDAEAFHAVLLALSRSQLRDSGDRALRVIERMRKHSEHKRELRPSIRSWNAVLKALSRSSTRATSDTTIQRAKAIMEYLYTAAKEGDSDCKPNSFTFTSYLCLYQMSSSPDAPDEVDRIIERMEAMYDRGELDEPPDAFHYTIQCSTWTRSNRPDSPGRVLTILAHAMRRTREGEHKSKPTTQTFNSVLTCLAKHGEAERADELLTFMITQHRIGNEMIPRPDSISFNHVIRAMTSSKLRDAGIRAENILERMIEYSEDQYPQAKPDFQSYFRILRYYVYLDKQDSPYAAEYVLNRAISRFEDGHEDLELDTRSFSMVIDAYARAGHPDAGRNADRLFNSAKRLQKAGAKLLNIDTQLINSVLNAWAVCGDESSGFRADKRLQDIEKVYNAGGSVAPNSRSYCLVLRAWSNTHSPAKFERSVDVYRRMQMQERNGNRHVSIENDMHKKWKRYVEMCMKRI